MIFIKKFNRQGWRNLLLLVFLSGTLSQLFASRIELNEDDKIYPLLNRKSNKIINYYELKPGDTLHAKTFEVDSLEVYSRFIINGNKEHNYSYHIKINDEVRMVERTAAASKVTRGLNGDEVSSYNLFTAAISSDNSLVSITNKSAHKILFKISGNNVISEYRVIDYIRYSPQEYGEERVMMFDEKSYTYYAKADGSIKLVLEGPIVLKVMSRYVFSRNYVNTKKYRFRVYDNNNLIGEYEETAHKSGEAYLLDEEEKILSTGDANILKLAKGVHHLDIENRDNNLDVIFRFYISKSSVKVEQK